MNTTAIKQELEKYLIQLGFQYDDAESDEDTLSLRHHTAYILKTEEFDVWIGVIITEPLEE